MSLGQTKWLHTYRSLLAMKKNPTLVKNMKHVKFDQIPPLSGPDPQGLINESKQTIQDKLEKTNGRNRQIINRHKKNG